MSKLERGRIEFNDPLFQPGSSRTLNGARKLLGIEPLCPVIKQTKPQETSMFNLKDIALAFKWHEDVNHRYADEYPYSVHLTIAFYFGMKYIYLIPEEAQSDVLSAILLHDSNEDARKSYGDIKKATNDLVAELVYRVTNNKGRTRKERANDQYYQEIMEYDFAPFVKLCDRLANVSWSKQSGSRMFEVYKKENSDFINKFKTNNMHIKYQPLIQELDSLFANG